MPSFRVDAPTLSLNIYDVIAKDSAAQVGFIGHTGLAKSTGAHPSARIPFLDMAPPLHGHDTSQHLQAHVVGSAELTDDEVQKIKTFIDRHAGEHSVFQQFSRLQIFQTAPQMYCIIPHATPLFEEDDGRYPRMRFSCAGFVLEAYRKARINLVNTNTLPKVEYAVIEIAYSSQIGLMNHTGISREDLGLEGDGPWPVLLCGYLFHALNRDASAIRHKPYIPSIEDRRFL